jgi:predicted DsbA family dithiol-disulfide isomerase
VRFVVKMYPYRYRDFSHIAAEAALAARDQGKFWEMHEKLLEKSPRLDRASLIEYAREVGLDMERFVRDLDAMKHKDVIERDKDLAYKLDLYNTPSFFFNGRMVLGNRPYESFQKILQEELDAAKNK